MKKSGIFIRIFAYTIIAMLLIVFVTAALFSSQIFTLFRAIERQQIFVSYQALVDRVQNSDADEVPVAAQKFHDNNQSFEFSIINDNGGVIYATPGADTSSNFNGDFYYVVYYDKVLGYSVVAQTRPGITAFYSEIIIRAWVAFAIILVLCLFCAYVFARQITNPIKQLAYDAGKMIRLEEVTQSMPKRRDELGALSHDIHAMYDKLKETISRLEDEILRVRALEETQRYFFSAASHELKTPIAATSVLLEGMIENVGDYKDHAKYLRECVKMMDAQSRTVSEILEIMRLNDSRIVPAPEKLDVRLVVADLLPAFQTLTESNGQHINVTISNGQNCMADPALLKKVLSNIIMNAVQNTPEEGEIRIWSEPAEGQYRLCILNTGVEIDDTLLPKLFDPFYRMDKARGRKSGRSGLGLTIVQKTLEAMNMEYALENTPDGVLFWMNLPKA